MYKEHLQNAIVKEMNICKRLFTKIPQDKMDFRPKEGIRSILELLQYLSFIGTGMPNYWLNGNDGDFGAAFGKMAAAAREMAPDQFLSTMDKQIEMTKNLFDQITEEDLFQKIVTYPWNEKAELGEAIISTSIKWLAAYRLQLFSLIKLCTDQKLGTADAWVLTELG